MFSLIKKLKQRGILSINQRNADFVLPYNSRKHYPIVDDKLRTKELAQQAGIAVPTLYTVIEREHQVKQLANLLEPYDDFVIKPAHGAGGDGIMVITNRIQDKYRQANGSLVSINDIAYHLSCSLSGAYSLSGHPDKVLIEKRVVVDPVFEKVSFEGVPDVRVITFLGYPAMAMVRLPTRQSNGKANLHQGAIGVGVDLASGKTLGGVFHNDTIDYHPDTLNPIADIQVPYWNEILTIAANCYELTDLGYLGVDIVLDKQAGPMMLELNARPGLNIQIANRHGLVHRYRQILAHAESKLPAKERITYIKQHFTSSPEAF